MRGPILAAALAFVALPAGAPAGAQTAAAPLLLTIDAREAPRRILHVKLDVPIAGGATTLLAPKWVPGEHGPLGPVVDLVALEATVPGGTRVAWRRDPVDLFAFTFAAPPSARVLTLHYDVLLAPNVVGATLALLDWGPAVLAPRGATVAGTTYAATLLLPDGWKAATALDGMHADGARVAFAPVTMERLLDSPVLAGANLTTVAAGPDAVLDVASDAVTPPKIGDDVRAAFTKLVAEAQTAFGGRHFRTPYHFLITATDAIGYDGLEHHESSWNGVTASMLTSITTVKPFAGDLLTHEFTHSWNGKYRRPAGLAKPDYQVDEQTDLLWVYEGLTEYYSDIFAVRAGFWTPDEHRAVMADRVARFDALPGRTTRTLADTTFADRINQRSTRAFAGERRAEDYYFEGELIWLDADTLIRERSRGAKSLDDFARAFFGGTSGPDVKPYTRADVVAALDAVLPYDWNGFFAARIDAIAPHAPIDGITRGGYDLRFVAKRKTPSPRATGGPDYTYGPGLGITPAGRIFDVWTGSPAAIAHLAPGQTVVAIDGRRWSSEAFAAAIERAAQTGAPIQLLVNDRDTFVRRELNSTTGPRVPELVRATGPDRIGAIVAPRAK